MWARHVTECKILQVGYGYCFNSKASLVIIKLCMEIEYCEMIYLTFIFCRTVLFNMQKICKVLGSFGWSLNSLFKWVNKKPTVKYPSWIPGSGCLASISLPPETRSWNFLSEPPPSLHSHRWDLDRIGFTCPRRWPRFAEPIWMCHLCWTKPVQSESLLKAIFFCVYRQTFCLCCFTD